MSIRFRFLISIFLLNLSLSSCVSMFEDSDENKRPPKITKNTPIKKAVSLAIKYGDVTLRDLKLIANKTKKWNHIHKETEKRLLGPLKSYSIEEIMNTVHLYQLSTKNISTAIVKKLIRSDKEAVRQVGWQLAANRPSKKIASLLEDILSLAIWNGEESKVMLPQMAQAAQANKLTSIYTLLRRGLMMKGDSEFAKAMITFDPKKATNDFMDYLSLATVEDLRQLNQSTINLHTCLVIFRHFLNYPVSTSHPKYSHLFIYSVSRNQVLKEMANLVLERQLPQYREQMAFTLARLPVWIQVAYVEGIRENLNTNVNLFLAKLKTVTAHKEVLEEIDDLKD